jgi:hypothetical protein
MLYAAVLDRRAVILFAVARFGKAVPARPKHQFWTGAKPSDGFEDLSAAALQREGFWWPH